MTDHAGAWNKWFPSIQQAAWHLSRRMLEEARLAPGHRVLDLATGIGEPALTAARRVAPKGHVVGVDVSEAMIDLARQRAETEGIVNAEFEVMALEALALPRHFDAVLCRWGLMFVDDLPAVLRRVHDVLRPGGRLSISVWASADETPTLSLAERSAHQALGLPPPGEGAQTPFALCEIPALTATLERAGYATVNVQGVPVTFEFSSLDDFLAYRQDLSTRFEAALAGLQKNDRSTALQAVIRAAEAYQDPADGTVRMENLAYCLSAVRP